MAQLDTIQAALARLRRGEASATDLVEAALAAIDRHATRTNALTLVHAARARTEAAAIDGDRDRGLDRGPLAGIPVTIKDLVDEAGHVTTAASHVLDDRVAGEDATVVTRLRNAGAIVIARTNLHQFGLGPTSDESSFGPVRHPDAADRSPGGSSGGAAVAVATGMGLGAIGTDTGGSIRIPAAACGVVGLKASAGEIPTRGVIPLSPTFDAVGPLAACVQDAGWLADVMAGRPPIDLPPWPPAGLRIVRLGGYFAEPIDPAVADGISAALDRLARLGASVVTRDLPGAEAAADAYRTIVRAEAAAWHGDRLDTRADDYLPRVRARLLEGRACAAVDYLAALATVRRLAREVDRLLEDADVLVTPTLPVTAPPIGADEVAVDPAGVRAPVRATMLRQTQPFSMTGHPALSLPVPTGGLPVGLQLVGRRQETARLLSLAAGVEAALRP